MLTIMVPALNEELYLFDTVNAIIRTGKNNNVELDIIIVDDGSKDRTPDVIKKLKKKYNIIRSISNKKNLGGGRSLIKVIKIAKGDKLFIIAGDGDMLEEDINVMFRNMNKAEMVFLYFLNKEIRGKFRNAISLLYNMIHTLFFNLYIQYISGPCIYPMEKLKKLDIKSKRFSIVTEISIKLLFSGCTYHEVAGYMNRGASGSSSLSLKNLIDVMFSFIILLIDVKLINRKVYNKTPIRVK